MSEGKRASLWPRGALFGSSAAPPIQCMYIICNIGFFSLARIDAHDQEGPTFVIRSRARQDLINLLTAAQIDPHLEHTPTRDYPWRVHVTPDGLRRVLLSLGENVGKGGALKEHPTRGDLYGTVWAVLAGIHDE